VGLCRFDIERDLDTTAAGTAVWAAPGVVDSRRAGAESGFSCYQL
jgi:hypothetical protein